MKQQVLNNREGERAGWMSSVNAVNAVSRLGQLGEQSQGKGSWW